MTGNTARERFAAYAEKGAEICRQLGFAGIALIWVFQTEVQGKKVIPKALSFAGLFIVISLMLDLLHYAVGAAFSWHRSKSKTVSVEHDEQLQRIEGWEVWLLWFQFIAVGLAYFRILGYLGTHVFTVKGM